MTSANPDQGLRGVCSSFTHRGIIEKVGPLQRALWQLRADLRSILGTSDVLILSEWLARQPVEVMLSPDADGMPILKYRPAEVQGCRLCVEVLALVVEAIARSTWTRLKACPDCQWIFYDHTKNKNKVWCLMTASGPQGRSCGSISKVRSFRERQKARAPRASNLPDAF